MTELAEALSIFEAFENKHLAAVKNAIEQGWAEDEEEDGWSPLMQAIVADQVETCRLLIADGVNLDTLYESSETSYYQPDGVDDLRCTALSLAMHLDRPTIAELLIKVGADVNATYCSASYNPMSSRTDAENCIMLAVKHNRIELQQLMLEYGLTIDQDMGKGVTPLAMAISEEKQLWVETLLSLGASPVQIIESQSFGKVPAVFFAIEQYLDNQSSERLAIIKLLAGQDGLCPLKFREDNEETSVIDYILGSQDQALIQLFSLENIAETIEDYELDQAYSKGSYTINAFTLLSVMDPQYQRPCSADIRSITKIVEKKIDFRDLMKQLDVEDSLFHAWHEGHEPIPYPAWRLMINIALEAHHRNY